MIFENDPIRRRGIEGCCKRNINFMYLLEGALHQTRPCHIIPLPLSSFCACWQRLLTETAYFLYEIDELSGDTIFSDGVKIEASSNKYTFI